jgi:hypothetical protein
MSANGVSPADRLKEARKIKDPDIRKDVVADVKRRIAENAQAQKVATPVVGSVGC